MRCTHPGIGRSAAPMYARLEIHARRRFAVSHGWNRAHGMKPPRAAAYSAQQAAAAGAGATTGKYWPSPVPATRNAWHITHQGDMSSLRLVEEAMPQLTSAGQVLVEVWALGLNPSDVFCCLGLYKAAPKEDFVPGLEFSGVVIAAAEQQDPDLHQQTQQQQQQRQQQRYKPGNRVLGALRFGAFASHVAIPSAYLRPMPSDWTLKQAASYPVSTLTAAFGLYECGGFRPGQCVLVHSAERGVGLQALHILARQQASALGLVGEGAASHLKVELLNSLCDTRSSTSLQAESNIAAEAAANSQRQQEQQQQQQHIEFAAQVSGESAVTSAVGLPGTCRPSRV
ncbi:chaperonin 10-like protein [Scenedesmus sp. NREL 46B-D3]|nr:chaperonin 10-like protein [Scenedesmus sp. NREL 46B-D3]